MYIANQPVDAVHTPDEPQPPSQPPKIPPVIYALGLTSLLTDFSSEMVVTVMPLYLSSVLQLSPFLVGLYDGIFHAITALVRVVAAHSSDRFRAHKNVAATGYALSAMARVLLMAASLGLFWVYASALLDRLGKGIRTAPRDALIASVAPAGQMGLAFGIHRRLDAIGAMLGPLLAAGLLWWWPEDFTIIFILSALSALLGLFVFCRRVPRIGDSVYTPTKSSLSVNSAPTHPSAAPGKSLVLACIGIFILNSVAVSDAMLYLALQSTSGFDAHYLPLLFVGASGVFMILAQPIGRWTDRAGTLPAIALGFAALVLNCLAVASGALEGMWALLLVAALMGVHYACTDGVIAMWVASRTPERSRTMALALIATAAGLGKLLSSTIFGALWQTFDVAIAAAAYAGGLLLILPMGLALLKLSDK